MPTMKSVLKPDEPVPRYHRGFPARPVLVRSVPSWPWNAPFCLPFADRSFRATRETDWHLVTNEAGDKPLQTPLGLHLRPNADQTGDYEQYPLACGNGDHTVCRNCRCHPPEQPLRVPCQNFPQQVQTSWLKISCLFHSISVHFELKMSAQTSRLRAFFVSPAQRAPARLPK